MQMQRGEMKVEGGMSEPKTEAPKSSIQFTKADDLATDYANHSHLESSNWDLRITFGHLEQSLGPNNVIQTTAITLPWAQAKVLHYFLTLHLISHEAELGRLIIPSGIIGGLPREAPAGVNEDGFHKALNFVNQFMAENPEAKPK
jgi:hypothetical protein